MTMKHRGWTLEPSGWNTLRDVMYDILGGLPECRLVRLSASSGNRAVATAPGVYMLCARTPKCNLRVKPSRNGEVHLYNALYVGEAQNLQKRYNDYAKGRGSSGKVKKLLQWDAIDFCYWEIPGATKQTRKKLQDIVVECLGPTANTQGGERSVWAHLEPGFPV